MARRRDTLGLALVSAASLSFELALTRLFAVQQFYHFAFIVVSLALMGTAASGLLLTARPRHPPLASLAAALSASVALAYLTLNSLPFDSYSLAWDTAQIAILFVYFLACGLPFTFTGWIVGACLAQSSDHPHRAYAANLLGAALGCLSAMLALYLFLPEGVAILSVGLALTGACVFSDRAAPRLLAATAAAGCLAFAWFLPQPLRLNLSPYKPLASARQALNAQVTLSRSSPAASLDVVEGAGVHAFPGLSLNASVALPRQAAIYLDGEGPLPLTDLDPDDPAARELAERMPASLAYLLRPGADALLMDAGGGLDALLALATGASLIAFPTDEPMVTDVLTGPYAEFTHHLLLDSRIRLLPRSSRGALQVGGAPFDIVQFCLSDSYRPVSSGAYALSEEYLLTEEALGQALSRLNDRGLLVVTRWIQSPPSESMRALAMLLSVLHQASLEPAASHLIAFRGMRTATLIASRQPFEPGELVLTRQFLSANGFDPILLPDLQADELNRYNRLPQDSYYLLASALMQDAPAAIAAHDFRLQPPTDDRPFFFHFFRWRQTPQLLQQMGKVWQPFGGGGYFVLLALLVLMVALGLPLALAPLALLLRSSSAPLQARLARHQAPGILRLLGYFALLGVGYLMVEIALIQQLTLLLNRPSISLAVVLSTLLLSSGIGSLVLVRRIALRHSLVALVLSLVLAALIIPPAIHLALPWPLGARLMLSAVLVSPCGLLMGIPFASGLEHLARRDAPLVAWAWGINGAASGVGGVVTALVILDCGLRAAVLLGACAYALACVVAPKRE